MKKFAIALLLCAGTLISFQANAGGPAVIGAVEGAVVGAHFGGAHGAVAGAIVGAVVGSAAEQPYYESRYREPARYAPARTYYAPPAQASYQPYYEPSYEPYYEPRRVVYVQPPVYDAYPSYYPAYYPTYYRTPVYVSRYGGSGRGYYSGHRGRNDHRGRY